jgi:hypothetical protein
MTTTTIPSTSYLTLIEGDLVKAASDHNAKLWMTTRRVEWDMATGGGMTKSE